jgi:hypothetical protein
MVGLFLACVTGVFISGACVTGVFISVVFDLVLVLGRANGACFMGQI